MWGFQVRRTGTTNWSWMGFPPAPNNVFSVSSTTVATTAPPNPYYSKPGPGAQANPVHFMWSIPNAAQFALYIYDVTNSQFHTYTYTGSVTQAFIDLSHLAGFNLEWGIYVQYTSGTWEWLGYAGYVFTVDLSATTTLPTTSKYNALPTWLDSRAIRSGEQPNNVLTIRCSSHSSF